MSVIGIFVLVAILTFVVVILAVAAVVIVVIVKSQKRGTGGSGPLQDPGSNVHSGPNSQP